MSPAGPVFRVVTWNVHGCVGRDGVCNPAGVADVLAELAPDLSALQEIDARMAVPGIDDVFGYFASRLGWSSLGARTIATAQGHYGHLLMSRWPLEALGVEDLSVPRREPRQALLASLLAPFGRLAIVAAHLGLGPIERRRQLRRLKRVLGSFGTRPIVALGDFNDPRRRGVSERALCPPLEPGPAPATFPARRPLLPLDRVWCSRPLEVLGVRTLPAARALSDHLPLVAELAVPLKS